MIRRLDAQIATVRRGRPDLRVIPPFFWDTSGRATIHGFLTTSLKLYGEEVFVRGVRRIRVRRRAARLDHYRLYRAHPALRPLGDLPITSVHIGECSGTMLRPAHYERFVIPYASRLGRELGPVRLHSCGRSDHLLAAIAEIANLGSLDTGSNTSVAAIRARFGADFRIDLAPPVELLLEGPIAPAWWTGWSAPWRRTGAGRSTSGFTWSPVTRWRTASRSTTSCACVACNESDVVCETWTSIVQPHS